MQKRTTEKAVRREPPGEAVARKTITIKDTAANGETRNGKLRNSHQLMQNGINNFDMATPCVQVVKFVQAACRGVFPLRSVWSSSRKDSTRRNYNAFMKRIEDFITLGRWESMNLTQLCKSMKTSMMPWLMHHNNGEEDVSDGSPYIVIATIYRKTLYIFQQNGHSTEGTLHLSIVLAWIFTDFLPHLLASCFYATEGEGTGGKVLYYRKQKWDVLRRRGEVEMMHHFTKVVIVTHVLVINCAVLIHLADTRPMRRLQQPEINVAIRRCSNVAKLSLRSLCAQETVDTSHNKHESQAYAKSRSFFEWHSRNSEWFTVDTLYSDQRSPVQCSAYSEPLAKDI